MNFSQIAAEGIKRIYDEDLDTQRYYLDLIAREVRHMPDGDFFFRAKAFFVPNEEYMLKYFGQECTDPMYDIYDFYGGCVWQNYVVFPIQNVAKTIVGFAGFDPFAKERKLAGEQIAEGHYKYSRASVFNRGDYLYCPPDVFDKGLSDGYIIVVDGIFDMWSLIVAGYNAACLMGSAVTEEIIFQLKFFKHVFFAQDNDAAGLRVANTLKMRHPNCHLLLQNVFKDVDETLQSPYRGQYLKALDEALAAKTDLVLKFKPKNMAR